MLDEALNLFGKGYTVFPCGRNKHPLVKWTEQKEQSNEEIKRLWNQFPTANIGLITGNGFIVIDADSDEATRQIERMFPHFNVKVRSGKGTHFYARTDKEIRCSSNKLTKVDIRGIGGYIVAPPSFHIESGKHYTWDGILTSIDGLPAIKDEDYERLLTITGNKSIFRMFHKEKPNNEKEIAVDYESNKPIEIVYSNILSKLHGVIETGKSSAKSLCPAHSDRNPSFNITLTEDKILLQCFAGCSLDSVCQSLGVKSNDLFKHQLKRKSIDLSQISYEKTKLKYKPQRKSFPKELMDPPGLIGEMCRYINDTAIKPQPILAIASSFACVGTLLGRKIETESGLRTNLFTVGIAKSGTGKEHARKSVLRIMSEAMVDEFYLGGESIASDTGMITELSANPSLLYQLDEFGRFLQVLSGKEKSPHLQNVITTLMSIYEKADVKYLWKQFADQKRERLTIEQPNVSIYGTTVPENFWSNINSGHVIDGFVNRFLIFTSEEDNPLERENPIKKPIPQKIIDSVKKMHVMPKNAYADEDGDLSHILTVKPKRLKFSDSALQLFKEYGVHIHKKINDINEAGSIHSAIWQRAKALAMKISLICAGSCFDDEITSYHAEYGIKLVTYLLESMCYDIDSFVSDNKTEANTKAVLNVIREGGKVTKTDLTRKLQYLTKSQRVDCIDTLLESGQITIVEDKNDDTNRVIKYYTVCS